MIIPVYLCSMQRVSVSDIWGAAWDRFKKKWYLGPILILLSILLFMVPILGILAYMILYPAIYVAYGLGVWEKQENSSFGDAFPGNILIYLKVILGDFIVFLVVLAYVFVADTISSAPVLPILPELVEGRFSSHEEEVAISIILLVSIWLLSKIVAELLTFFYPYFIVDRNAGVFSALRDSINLSVRNLGTVILFIIIASLVNLLGILMLGIGLLLTLPVTFVAEAGLYKSLVEKEFAT